MATQLSLYNEALRLCGERKLASLTENREPRRLLDSVWDADAINYCLEQGQWKFAIRTAKLEYNPSMEPAFGYQYGFDKPTDLVRITALCSDEYFNVPLTQYSEEAGYWFSDLDEIYIQYVSNDASYGADFSLYPETYMRYVASYLASEIIDRLTQNNALWDKVYGLMKKRLTDARSKDALAGPTKFFPSGSWLNARRGNARTDRGNRNNLIG
jgi:hypothetical protein